MAEVKRFTLDIPADYQSREAALFLAQLDNLSERMHRDLRELSPADLSWQPMPGGNTIGMLLIHNAKWEVFWFKRVVERDPDPQAHTEEVIGIPFDTDGIPIAHDALPPTALAEKTYSYFQEILDRSRNYSRTIARTLTDEDMLRETSWDSRGRPVLATPQWMLYHLLEHQAGHYGQMLLIKHMLHPEGE